jgi:predicted XRE-type DNA-binding protein
MKNSNNNINNNKNYQYPPHHEEILMKMKHPDYEGNFLLPAEANSLDKTKYNLCKTILNYKQDNDLTTEELAEKINLSFPETKEILLCHIYKFTLDRLITYLDKLFPQVELKIIKSSSQQREYLRK